MTITSQSGSIKINVVGRTHPQATDYWDGNWLIVDIYIQVGELNESYRTQLRSDEINQFNKELLELNENQRTIAILNTMEGGFGLEGNMNSDGSLEWKCLATLAGKPQHFGIVTDRSILDDLLKEIAKILEDYPVVGNPDE